MKVPIINWLDCEGLRFVQTIKNNEEQENAKQVRSI